MKRILAFDLGASSGRAMIAEYRDGKIKMEEIHRFQNDPVMVHGTLYWDTLRLLYNIKTGITKAVNAGGFDLLGIDTWGVDFGLIGKDGQMVANPVHYRDKRTDDYEEIYKVVSRDELYQSTGMQEMQLNTIHQLYYLTKHKPELLALTDKILFTPDLLNYFLTGEMKSEYTIASTSELLDAKKRDWNYDLIRKAGIDPGLLCEIVQPGTPCGVLSPEIQEELGAPAAQVMCITSHDTASAVVAVPTQEDDFIYVSCGTWSLLGTELAQPCISEKSREYNFTNEGSAEGKIRFLKNIMGTWLNQESRRQWIREGKEYSFSELDIMAGECEPFRCFIDVDASDFSKPGNMPRRIRAYCERTVQYVPQTEGEIIRCIDESLAMKYRNTIMATEECTGIQTASVHIMGGGANSKLLCQLAANASGRTVLAGPTEATALGNIAVQLIACGEIKDVKEARKVIADSSELKTYEPQDTGKWSEAYQRFLDVTGIGK